MHQSLRGSTVTNYFKFSLSGTSTIVFYSFEFPWALLCPCANTFCVRGTWNWYDFWRRSWGLPCTPTLWSLANTWWNDRQCSQFLEHVQSSKFLSPKVVATSSLWCQCVLTYAWRLVPSNSIFSQLSSSDEDCGIPECDAGQNSNFSANQWLPGQLPEFRFTWTRCHRCLMTRKTFQNDTSKNNHATSNASPLSGLHRGKSKRRTARRASHGLTSDKTDQG